MVPTWLTMGRDGYFPVLDEDIPTNSELRLPLESKTSSKNGRSWWIYVMLFLQTGLIVALLVSLHILANRHPSDIACAKQLSPYCEFLNEQLQAGNPSLLTVYLAPYLEDGDLELEEFTELNHLMQPSPYRGYPSPEVEEAWIKLWRGELAGLLKATA